MKCECMCAVCMYAQKRKKNKKINNKKFQEKTKTFKYNIFSRSFPFSCDFYSELRKNCRFHVNDKQSQTK